MAKYRLPSLREASVLCYIGQTILQAFRVGIMETNLKVKTTLMEVELGELKNERPLAND